MSSTETAAQAATMSVRVGRNCGTNSPPADIAAESEQARQFATAPELGEEEGRADREPPGQERQPLLVDREPDSGEVVGGGAERAER